MHMMADADVSRLRGVKDNLTLTISDLKLRLDGLKEELQFMKTDHEEVRGLSVQGDICFIRWRHLLVAEALTFIGGQMMQMSLSFFCVLQEMRLLRVQCSGSVNVEVDSAESSDLSKVLHEMREQYETVVNKNKVELERWFQTKVRFPKKQNKT